MAPRKLPPTKPAIKLREPEQIGAPVEQHVPVVASDDMQMPKRLVDLFDRALAEGVATDADGCTARKIEDQPKEAALVHLPKSDMLYVSLGDIRPAERWLPCAHLQKQTLNGWDYLSAGRLYSEPSLRIFEALESLFGRGSEPRELDAYSGGSLDMSAKKMTGVEKVEIDALVEFDLRGSGSASRVQYVKFRGAWLPLRRLGRLAFRAEKPQLNFNPTITIT